MNKLFLIPCLALLLVSCKKTVLPPNPTDKLYPNLFVYDHTEFTPTKINYKVKENGYEKVNTVGKESTVYDFNKPAFEEFVPEVVNFGFRFMDESNYALFKSKNGELITTDSIVLKYVKSDSTIEMYDPENRPFYWFDYNEDISEIWSTSISIFYDSGDLTIVDSGALGKKSLEDYLNQKDALKKLKVGDTFSVLTYDSYFRKN